MRILLAHNRYQQRGGEDFVFETERALLENAGHEVVSYERRNEEIRHYPRAKLLDLPRRVIWATDSTSSIRRILREFRPEIAHFYNTFPLISPAAYYECAKARVPVVQTIPNFRLMCPGATFLRNKTPCELCLCKTIPWPSVYHACYRGSRVASTVVASMLAFHHAIGTWGSKVNVYIALTEFARQKFIEGGLPEEKIVVKPNFISPDPGEKTGDSGFALFVGRISEEKGIRTLLDAWRALPEIPLKVAGDGPLMPLVASFAEKAGGGRIQVLGWRSRDEVIRLMKGATFLVMPSEWYEGFPLTIVESFACGLPVLGSRLGGVGEVIIHERSGLHFEPGNSVQLATAVRRLWADEELRLRLGSGARAQFESQYTSERNYEMMMAIFENALK